MSEVQVQGQTNDEQLNTVLEGALIGKNVTFVVVGPAGVGKSTLVNTIMTEKICEEGTSAEAVTPEVQRKVRQVPLEGGSASLVLYDSPGFTGNRRSDRAAAEGLETTRAEADEILICFDLLGNGGRYIPLLHGAVMEKIVGVFGEDIIKQKGLVVLTRANLVSDQSGSTGVSATALANQWKQKFQEDQEELADLPVFAAGRAHFNDANDITHISEIDGTTEWFNELWNEAASRSVVGERNELSALMAVICRRQRERTRDRRGQREQESQGHENWSDVSLEDSEPGLRPMEVDDFPEVKPKVQERIVAFLKKNVPTAVVAGLAAFAAGAITVATGGAALAVAGAAAGAAAVGTAVAKAVKSWYKNHRGQN